MRYVAFALFASLLCQSALAEYQCKIEQGCIQEFSSSHDIGNGTMIVLPKGWKFYRFPVPREPEGLTILRMEKEGVVIAIEGFPNLDKREITEEWLRGLLTKAAQSYIELSREKQLNYVSISHDDVVGGYAAFTSGTGELVFPVLGKTKDASVTALIASTKLMIFSVSIVSNRAPDEDYQAALDAVRNMR